MNLKTWILDDALEFIRDKQPNFKKLNYHLALAGSVLNSGQSDNDLDIIILPLGDSVYNPIDLEHFLVDEFNASKLSSSDTDYDDADIKIIYRSYWDGRQIDWFLYGV
jgi:hypothetical protein